MTENAGKGSSVKLKYAPITTQSAYTKAVTKAYWKAEKLKNFLILMRKMQRRLGAPWLDQK
jgi:hypothetical protein